MPENFSGVYNIPALAKIYGVDRSRVRQWHLAGRLGEPDTYLAGRPIWYSIPPRPEPITTRRKLPRVLKE